MVAREGEGRVWWQRRGKGECDGKGGRVIPGQGRGVVAEGGESMRGKFANKREQV